jgi:2-(1,2-epoxy-1,2-dihydrophenyl)acetyl-CoA isomerase
MPYENILFEKSGAVATITLNRPKSFNAMDMGLLQDLLAALETCGDDDALRALVVTGAGRAFCSGGDLGAFKDAIDTNPVAPIRDLVTVLNRVILALRNLPMPAIAAINGAVGGAGMSLAAACDLRLCAASAKFRQAYTGVALVPDGGWTLLVPLLIGYGRAAELVLLNEPFDAQKALAWGLVHQVVEDGELAGAAAALAGRIAEGPTRSFAITKGNFNAAMMGLLERQLEVERTGICSAARTLDYQDGVTAFFEKRPATFTGK